MTNEKFSPPSTPPRGPEAKPIEAIRVVKTRQRKKCGCGALHPVTGEPYVHYSRTNTLCRYSNVAAIEALKKKLEDATSSSVIPAAPVSPIKLTLKRKYAEFCALEEENKSLTSSNMELQGQNVELISEVAQLKHKLAKQDESMRMLTRKMYDELNTSVHVPKYHTILRLPN